MRTDHDAVVLGAGPYGLAATAYLRAAGLDVRALGTPMALWEDMPVGMFLRSSWEASSIADPDGALTLDAYVARERVAVPRPIPLADFLRYARWYRLAAVPDVDERHAAAVRRNNGNFALELDDGTTITTVRVFLATGPGDFPRRPACLDVAGAPLVRHSAEIHTYEDYVGRRTVIVGSGQSAIELAALLHEAGAEVEVIARASRIHWLVRSGRLHREGVLQRLLYARTDVGPVGLSHLVARPLTFRKVPVRLADPIAYRCIRPAAASWLVDRTNDVPITLSRAIPEVTADGDRLRLALDDGSRREVERLVLATGFDVRADRHPLLGREILAALQMRGGMPLLDVGFESSVPGLHFLGAFAAASFGPVMRFVSGTPFTGAELARRFHRTRRRPSTRARPTSAAA